LIFSREGSVASRTETLQKVGTEVVTTTGSSGEDQEDVEDRMNKELKKKVLNNSFYNSLLFIQLYFN